MISKVKDQGRNVAWSAWQVLACKPRRKRPRNTEIGRNWLRTRRAIAHTSFKDKRSRSPHRLMLRLKVYHIYRTGRPTNFNLGRRMEHALSTAKVSYKGLWSWVIARGRGHIVSTAPGGHTTCYQLCHGCIKIQPQQHLKIITVIIQLTVVDATGFAGYNTIISIRPTWFAWLSKRFRTLHKHL